MPHFNGLTPAEAERLAYLAEKCAEVIGIICKIQRHGFDSFHPDRPPPEGETNREMLEREIGDVLIGIGMLSDSGDVAMDAIERHSDKGPPLKWLHHQEGCAHA